MTETRQLGSSNLFVSPVSLGTWPMAGTTSPGVNDADSIATIRSCAGVGVNFIDTAYCYGPNGESENLIRQAISSERDSYVIASKCGIHYNSEGQQEQDARPETILQECDESLQRMGIDHIDLYYLHSPDPEVPVAESAGAIAELMAAGKVSAAGVSNAHLPQLEAFHAVCPVTAVQLPYNMLQRGIEEQTIPWCQKRGIAVVVYWALMKGLLAGHITREHPLDSTDKRLKYPMYQGEEWEKNLQFIDEIRTVAEDAGKTVAQVVINWTIFQPGIAATLCGAKRPWQFAEVAGAMGWQLNEAQHEIIDKALAKRGKALVNRVFY
ncbi:aldo/keto reductase [Bythopirellula polymerisocia]|uniref:General stress protein 69 n=1 Tax=Bythopirellula polymerisocia TaxID=2528003 RepID=A0A5C6CQZ0_9BACT|nr:aldo/keto reductase [Bythopirellula polymerisocia]TWU25957.1 General stress protein 69 [Bythopirellula polymerisocia]